MYSKTTNHIKITVIPMYLAEQSNPAEFHYVWAYTIQIENLGQDKVQLLNRHWRITDGHGALQEVRGPGVVGEQPLLEPGDHFQYTSGVALKTNSGIMTGTYEMINDQDQIFLVEIPAFSLDSPEQVRRPN
ncbi:MAG: Co2+/Mg2+ efflux protein ApaG [Alphaproteobacteria bacterium]|nr:Co2+/Mg2+ efflux protein ApaG [Alphaproteobacteria bacterium]